jgi:hypothetical protein
MNQNLAGILGFLLLVVGVALPLVANTKEAFDLLPLMLACLCWVAAFNFLHYALKRGEKP